MSKGDTRRKSQVSDTQFTNNWNTIFKGSDMPSDLLQKFTAYCNEINSIRHKIQYAKQSILPEMIN